MSEEILEQWSTHHFKLSSYTANQTTKTVYTDCTKTAVMQNCTSNASSLGENRNIHPTFCSQCSPCLA